MKNNNRNGDTPKNYRRKVRRVLAQVRAKYNVKGNFTERDFLRVCRLERIILIHPKFAAGLTTEKAISLYKISRGLLGFYIKKHDAKFLYLRCFFYKTKRFDLFTAMHELGHHFLAHSDDPLFNKTDRTGTEPLPEAEADYFAELATGKREASK